MANSDTTPSTKATIYTTRYCGYCMRAKSFLLQKGVNFNEVPVDGDTDARADLLKRTGQRTVPQIWIGDRHIGGCDDLIALEMRGELDSILMR